MGFFDDLFSSPSESTSGYGALPQAGRSAYKRISKGINQYATGANNIHRFTPMGATADENRAFGAMRQGFTPTAQSISNDMSMLMNPYNQHVIDGIKRYTQGEHSNLQSYMQGMGQMGSSRDMVNATEADRMQGQLIGEFLQGQYDKALDYSTGRFADQRMQDAQNLLGIGGFLRNLDLQTKQAPISMLNAASNILNQSGTSGAISSSGTSVGESDGNMDEYGDMIKVAGQIIAMSDERLKENIEPVGIENGYKIYEYNYKGDPQRYRGVMAQDVLKKNPDAVIEVDGYLAVKYGDIGVNFARVN